MGHKGSEYYAEQRAREIEEEEAEKLRSGINMNGLRAYKANSQKEKPKKEPVQPEERVPGGALYMVNGMKLEVRYDREPPPERGSIRKFLKAIRPGASFELPTKSKVDLFRKIGYQIDVRLAREKQPDGSFLVWRIK